MSCTANQPPQSTDTGDTHPGDCGWVRIQKSRNSAYPKDHYIQRLTSDLSKT